MDVCGSPRRLYRGRPHQPPEQVEFGRPRTIVEFGRYNRYLFGKFLFCITVEYTSRRNARQLALAQLRESATPTNWRLAGGYAQDARPSQLP